MLQWRAPLGVSRGVRGQRVSAPRRVTRLMGYGSWGGSRKRDTRERRQGTRDLGGRETEGGGRRDVWACVCLGATYRIGWEWASGPGIGDPCPITVSILLSPPLGLYLPIRLSLPSSPPPSPVLGRSFGRRSKSVGPFWSPDGLDTCVPIPGPSRIGSGSDRL